MLSTYCPSCGKPNQYSDIKPNFCGFCQAPLTVGAISQTVPLKTRRRRAEPQPEPKYQDDDDDDNYDQRPQSRALANLRGVRIELKPQLKDEMLRERIDMSTVFQGGIVGVKNSPENIAARAEDKSFKQGNKDAYLTETFVQRTFQSAKDKPQEIGG